ncbi:P2RY6 protein, partial [Atractosteus spatula]|nr:P2RY6 protein [Atractosteus spatula]
MEAATAVLGLPANVLVLWVLLRNKTDFSTAAVFTLNLAVMDTLYCLSSPLDIYNYYCLRSDIIYRISLFFYGLNEIGGPLFLSSICVDRYVAVVHPITYIGFKDGRYRLLGCGVIWATTTAYCFFSSYTRAMFYSQILTVCYSAVLVLMVFCNLSILRGLAQSGPARETIHPMKRKAFKSVLCILFIMLANYAPVMVVLQLGSSLPAHVLECYVIPAAYFFITISSFVQPVTYLYSIRNTPWRLTTNSG